MPNTVQHIGHRIEAAMKEKNVGPTEVAAFFKITAPSVTGWINTGRIGKDKIRGLVTYFGKPVEWWLDGIMPDESAPYTSPEIVALTAEQPAPRDYIGPALKRAGDTHNAVDWNDAQAWLGDAEIRAILDLASKKKREYLELLKRHGGSAP